MTFSEGDHIIFTDADGIEFYGTVSDVDGLPQRIGINVPAKSISQIVTVLVDSVHRVDVVQVRASDIKEGERFIGETRGINVHDFRRVTSVRVAQGDVWIESKHGTEMSDYAHDPDQLFWVIRDAS